MRENPVLEISFEACSIQDIPVITEAMEEKLDELEVSMKSAMLISIAIDELYSNIVKFAYKGKPGYACVQLISHEDCVEIRFIDRGLPYNPLLRKDPDTSPEALKARVGGLGIYMVKNSMDNLTYEYVNEENHLHLFKNL